MKQGVIARSTVLLAVSVTLVAAATREQETPQSVPEPSLALTESGHSIVDGHPVAYTIHRLPPNAFPGLPPGIAELLDRRGCLIPQTYEAHQPENLVHASLEQAGSSDWAVLCSAKGTVSLLIFFASAPEQPFVLATAPEADRLQQRSNGAWGFNWAIDPASPERVHEAQMGLQPRPARPDHDALADSIIEHKTVFHFYAKGKWTLLDMPD